MRKQHFIALGQAIARVLAQWAQWSEPGSGGRAIGLDVAEGILLAELAEMVEREKGDGRKWKQGVNGERRNGQ